MRLREKERERERERETERDQLDFAVINDRMTLNLVEFLFLSLNWTFRQENSKALPDEGLLGKINQNFLWTTYCCFSVQVFHRLLFALKRRIEHLLRTPFIYILPIFCQLKLHVPLSRVIKLVQTLLMF